MDDRTAAERFLVAADAAIELIGSPECAERWDRASVLDGYSVGALAAHLGRAITTVTAYLAGASPKPDGPDDDPIGAVAYFVTVLVDHDPVDSEFHRAVRARGAEAAENGPVALVAGLRSTRHELGRQLGVPGALDQRIEVIGGLRMRLGDYLDTRLVELCVHLDDLAASLDRPVPPVPAAAWERVAEVVAGVAARRHGAARLALSLARTERTDRVSAF